MGKILDAIDQAIYASQDVSPRKHLGASVIGDSCARKIWFGFRWATKTLHKPSLLRLFERGKLEEGRFIGWLKAAGVKVWQDDPATGKQFTFKGYKGHFGGEIDGVGQGVVTDDPYLLEFKTHNNDSFKSLVLNGVEMDKPTHFVQMQIYMGAFNLPQTLYLAINKNNDEIHAEMVPFNGLVYNKYISRAIMIIDASSPPPGVSKSPSWYQCKWCDHKNVCHNKLPPEVNCRTCAHSTPILEGKWQCEKSSVASVIDANTMLIGCDGYVAHPME